MKRTKISFDFDDTLSNIRVQHLAYQFIQAGMDVHIVTSRMSNKLAGNPSWNADIELIASTLNIPEEKTHFCNLRPKYEFFKENPDFLCHLDDDLEEVQEINLHTDTKSILFVDSFVDVSLRELKGYILENNG